jgi:membrane protease YdiL (CAAX protease family)
MENAAPTKEKHHLIIAWTFLAGLLILRLPFAGGILFFTNLDWVIPAFQVGTYLLTACLIWWERDRLADFNIDTLALAIIIIFKPIQTIILSVWGFNQDPLAFPNPPSLIIWIISIGLLIALWRSHSPQPKLSKKSFGWFGVGILVGLFAALLLAYPMSLQVDKSLTKGLPNNILALLLMAEPLRGFFYQLGYAAVTEEPLFRGFLWGYLHKAGWKTVWIWLFQAGLFMLGHIYYIIKYPISFWLVVPIDALILGALVWRSKTISSSLAAHATGNALGMTMGIIVASFRA